MLEDTLLTHPHVRVQAADQMNSFIYCEKLEFLKCHIHTTVKCDRKPNRASNRISYADRKVWNFLNKAEKYRYIMPSQIAPYCHIVIVSRLFSCGPSPFPPYPMTYYTDQMPNSYPLPV